MSVEYSGSTVAAMDMDSKIGYKQFFSEANKFQYSGKYQLHSKVIPESLSNVVVVARTNCLKTSLQQSKTTLWLKDHHCCYFFVEREL